MVAMYLVERALPGATMASVAALQHAAGAACRACAVEGKAVRYVRSIFTPGDSRCRGLFEASDADLVQAVNEAAQLPFSRIALAVELEPTGARSTRWRTARLPHCCPIHIRGRRRHSGEEERRMKGFIALLSGLAGLLLVTGVAAAQASRQDPGPVYTVAQVLARLAHDPQAWANRRVQVRASAGGCIPWAAPKGEPCIDEVPELVEMRAGTLVAALPVVCGQDPPLPEFVRALPWLGRLVPAPQALVPGKLAVYRIQLPRTSGYDALLLDSLPRCGDA